MKMKSSLVSLFSVLGLVIGFTTVTEAGPGWGNSSHRPGPSTPSYGGDYGHSHGGSSSGYHGNSSSGYHGNSSNGYHGGSHGGYNRPYYGPPRVVHTREISRRYVYRKGFNRFGRPATFKDAIITYLETYSNGTTRTYTTGPRS